LVSSHPAAVGKYFTKIIINIESLFALKKSAPIKPIFGG